MAKLNRSNEQAVALIQPLPPYFFNSIFQKALVALSGMVLIAFAIFHLLGNLLLFQADQSSFNRYAASLNRWPIAHGALELVLIVAVVIHVGLAIAIARRNRQAQPQNYVATSWWRILADRSMVYTGPLLLLFLLVHLRSFRLGPIALYQTKIADQILPDWQSLVIATFQQPLYVGFYLSMMLPLAIHLRHGLKSVGQSLGLVHNPWSERASWLVATTMAIGFGIIPAWIYWQH
jgi:succinate dehydrogenase / fumarate reductase, cytochrome b subunit